MTKGYTDKMKAQLIKELEKLPQQVTGANDSESIVHQLEASELRYRRLFEAAQDGILILNAVTAQIVEVNPFLVEMLGYSKEEFLGKKLWEVGAFRNTEAAKLAFVKLQSERYIRYEDMPLETKDGKLISVEFISNVYDVDHTSVIQCNIRDITDRTRAGDALAEARNKLETRVKERTSQLTKSNEELVQEITERKRVEENLASSERKYRQLVEEMREGVWIIDKDACTSFANPRMAEMLGYTVNEMQGRPLFSFMDERGVKIAKRLLKRRNQGIAEQHDFEFVRKDGRRIYVILETSPISDETRNYVGALGCATEITERRQAEEALKTSKEALATSEKRYSTIFASAAEGILIADIATKQFKYTNPAICKMLGYSQEELKEMTLGDIHPKDSLKHLVSEFEAQAKGEKTLAEGVPCLRKDGTILYADINSAGALLDGTQCMVGFFTNATERMLAEKERSQNTEKILKAMGDTIKAIAMTVEIRDPYTSGHQQRVSSLATCIAQEMGLPAVQIEGIHIAGIVHDIGKMYVPLEILSSPRRLNVSEFDLIKMHAQAGYDILKIVEFPWPIAQAVLQHHERMDGSGYPGRVLGKDIILEARILAVADVVEAMVSHRPYRPALGIDKALENISQKRGILYDLEVVDACLKVITEKRFKFQ
jgi:PAS domain S-box-containing protein